MKTHRYEIGLTWTGNTGEGTRTYRSYGREHRLAVAGKPPIRASSDPAFRGDPTHWNPEEMLVASLASCHMLWLLHLAAAAGIVVTAYEDAATGVMTENPDGSGQFESVTLRPRVTVANPADRDRLAGLHDRAHAMCFVARSMGFPVRHEPEVVAES
jgi:organic hydroperoxide reductase OsmC/OhrA